jgi:hyaluronoglucosaminidase
VLISDRMAALLLVVVGGCGSRAPSVGAACADVEYPAEKWATADGCRVTSRVVCLSTAAAAIAPLRAELAAYGMLADDDCGLAIDVALGVAPPASVRVDYRAHEGGYAWSTVAEGRSCHVTVYADSPAGADHAVHALLGHVAATPAIVPSVAADWPSFAVRGVIEGFYNRYFTRDERRRTLLFMHQLRMSTYLYAPKDDVYAGYRWRDPYPADAAADIAAAATDAAAQGVDLVYGISPTLSTNGQGPEASFRFSSADDFAALMAKLDGLRAVGVPRFALLLDDASRDLYHPEDRAAFPSAAAAHADLANRLVAALDARVWLVAPFYTSQFDGWDDYNRQLGQALDARVDVLWTGPTVFSPAMAASDLAQIDMLLGRQVVIWDNWPTAAVPVTGRSADLPGATQAMMTNATLVGDEGHPVSDFWRVMGPLGDYAWDAGSYDAQSSFYRWAAPMARLVSCMPYR